MELKDVVAISAVRTPMGRFGGTIKDMASYDLGAAAVKEALRRAEKQAWPLSSGGGGLRQL